MSFGLLLSIAAPSRAQQQQNSAGGNTGVTPASDESALRTQVLETTRDTAKVAMEVTRDTAASAIDGVKNSNETLTTIFQAAAAVMAAVATVLVTLGIWDRKALRESFEEKLKQAETSAKHEFSGRLEELMAQLKAASATQLREQAVKFGEIGDRISIMNTDMVQAKLYIPELQKGDSAARRSALQALASSLERIKKNARELRHTRTLSWAHTHHAIALYYVEDFEAALSEQELSLEHNEGNWPDRHYNYACIAMRVLEKRADDSLRSKARDHLKRAVDADPQQAVKALADSDLKSLLESDPDLRSHLDAAARGAAGG
jgi:tetratricopeptide (TPR) repeat protein